MCHTSLARASRDGWCASLTSANVGHAVISTPATSGFNSVTSAATISAERRYERPDSHTVSGRQGVVDEDRGVNVRLTA